MKDPLSAENLQQAADELLRMQEEKEERRCACRFEKKQTASSRKSTRNRKVCIKADEDKFLILALILILSYNSDDKILLFALLYIIM